MKYQSIKREAKYSTRTTHQCNANYMRHKCHRNKEKTREYMVHSSHSLTFQHNASISFEYI